MYRDRQFLPVMEWIISFYIFKKCRKRFTTGKSRIQIYIVRLLHRLWTSRDQHVVVQRVVCTSRELQLSSLIVFPFLKGRPGKALFLLAIIHLQSQRLGITLPTVPLSQELDFTIQSFPSTSVGLDYYYDGEDVFIGFRNRKGGKEQEGNAFFSGAPSISVRVHIQAFVSHQINHQTCEVSK